MAGNGGKLGRKQEEAIAALMAQRNIEEAARAAGVGTRTLIRWLKLPEFRVAYREARRAAFSQSIARLQQASSAAATTLLKIMLDVNAPASTRVRAADSVLDHAKQAIEIEDIEVRVAALEATTAGGSQRKMKTLDGRIRKVEDRFWIGNGKQPLLLVLCHTGWGLALDQDRCI